jgi:hypothetical protein
MFMPVVRHGDPTGPHLGREVRETGEASSFPKRFPFLGRGPESSNTKVMKDLNRTGMPGYRSGASLGLPHELPLLVRLDYRLIVFSVL